PLRALSVEAVVEPRFDPPEVALQRLPRLTGEPGLTLLEQPLGPREERVDPRLHPGRRRHLARVEVDEQAHGASLRRPEACKFPQLLPAHHPCHDRLPCPWLAILCLAYPGGPRDRGTFRRPGSFNTSAHLEEKRR